MDQANEKDKHSDNAIDYQFAKGYSEEGDDWSYAKSSERTDRPLPNAILNRLTKKSDKEGFKQLGMQYTMIFSAGVVIWHFSSYENLVIRIFFQMLGTLVMGFGLVTMGHCAQHECIHNTAFKSRYINSNVSWLVSLPRLTNPVWEKMLHKDHHTYTNDPDKDPEIMSGNPRNALPGNYHDYVVSILRIGGGKYFLGVWSSRVAVLINCARGNIVGYSGFDPVPEKKAKYVRRGLQSCCRRQLMFYGVVLSIIVVMGWWSQMIRYWLLPMLVGEPCHAFFHIADHLNCEHDFKNGTANTRTTPAPWFVRFNMWNMNYHAEHHLYPSIPFHKLPIAHDALIGRFKHTSPSALSMHKQLITRWIPYFQTQMQKGIAYVETKWVPCTPDTL